MPLPLSGIRVIAIEQYGAGPWATLQLADLGAEVIKVEDPQSGGDVGRYVPPYQAGEDSLFFETFNRNKQSISLDLRTSAGQTVLFDLVGHSDVIFSNLRGDVPERLGLLYENLAPLNPRIVCCSLSGFGGSGPRVRDAGYDYLVQGLTGWMSLTGQADEPPSKSGLSLVDFSAGYAAALAMLAGIMQARTTGEGCDCEVSLFETALHQLTYLATWVATAGYEPERFDNSAHPSIVPFQNFKTRDGWIVIACPKEKFWINLCTALEVPELVTDERFVNFAARRTYRDQLVTILEQRLRERTTDEWLKLFVATEVPSSPVNDVASALADPQVAARQAIVEIDHPRFGLVRQIASPLLVGPRRKTNVRAPFRGEHLEDVLARVCGYDVAGIRELALQGAFGASDATESVTIDDGRVRRS